MFISSWRGIYWPWASHPGSTSDWFIYPYLWLSSVDTDSGKSTIYVRQYNAQLDGHTTDEPYVAISNRCMHLGCPVRYVQAAARFICPCHGGIYGPLGQVDGGPPVRPLDRFYTRVVNGRVEIGARYSLDSHFKRFPHPRDPSNHLDGLWQYLYPSRPTT